MLTLAIFPIQGPQCKALSRLPFPQGEFFLGALGVYRYQQCVAISHTQLSQSMRTH